MTHIETFKLALEALKIAYAQIVDPDYAPIGWNVSRMIECHDNAMKAIAEAEQAQPVAWEGLTDSELLNIGAINSTPDQHSRQFTEDQWRKAVQDIENKLKSRNK